jgi:hypothetical protein
MMTHRESSRAVIAAVAGGVLLVLTAGAFWLGTIWIRPKAHAVETKPSAKTADQDVGSQARRSARPRLTPVRAESAKQEDSESPEAKPDERSLKPSPLDARQERDEQVETLRTSGAAHARDVTTIRAVETEWTQAAKAAGVAVDFTPWQCFQAGCYTTATYRDPVAAGQFMDGLSRTPSFNAWPAGKFQSGPIERPSGGFEITWVFSAPEEHASNTNKP